MCAFPGQLALVYTLAKKCLWVPPYWCASVDKHMHALLHRACGTNVAHAILHGDCHALLQCFINSVRGSKGYLGFKSWQEKGAIVRGICTSKLKMMPHQDTSHLYSPLEALALCRVCTYRYFLHVSLWVGHLY